MAMKHIKNLKKEKKLHTLTIAFFVILLLLSCSITTKPDNKTTINISIKTKKSTVIPFININNVSTILPSEKIDISEQLPTTLTPIPTIYPYSVSKIGTSVNGYEITGFHFGDGNLHLILIGGIHGGYEWNTILLGYEIVDYLKKHTNVIPDNVLITVIPSLNMDGQVLVTGKTSQFTMENIHAETTLGRFNGNGVDLNRNWDCNWSSEALWRQQTISGGSTPFSEPESFALRDFIINHSPNLVIFYHSAASGIFLSQCNEQQANLTKFFAKIYSDGSNYPVYSSFSAYPITGDASDYLATQNIPSFSVELTNHTDTEFERNILGILKILTFFDQK